MNTTIGSLSAGVALVVIPITNDQPPYSLFEKLRANRRLRLGNRNRCITSAAGKQHQVCR